MAADDVTLKLARAADAEAIARMSRDLIEQGLGWRWTAAHVARQIRCPDTLVLTARSSDRLLGFAIMHYGFEEAHLLLLAVRPQNRRQGIGRRLVAWLEKSARVAGVATVYLEVRAVNRAARAFYESLGYETVRRLPGYYSGRETALRMAHSLRVSS